MPTRQRFARLLAVILTLSVASRAFAAPGAATKPAAAAPAAPDPEDPGGMNKVIPEVDFKGVALEDVIDFLQDVSPGFHAVVVYDAGAPAAYPRVTLRAKNVTAGQLVQLVHLSFPDVEISDVEGAGGPLGVFHIRSPRPGDEAAERDPRGGVHVYRLTAAVDQLLPPEVRAISPGLFSGGEQPDTTVLAKERKRALDGVLTLLKAALAQCRARRRSARAPSPRGDAGVGLQGVGGAAGGGGGGPGRSAGPGVPVRAEGGRPPGGIGPSERVGRGPPAIKGAADRSRGAGQGVDRPGARRGRTAAGVDP